MPSNYTTTQGDTWDIIARKLWNRETMCSVLMSANPAYMGTVVFSAGVVLTVPAITAAPSRTKAPWEIN